MRAVLSVAALVGSLTASVASSVRGAAPATPVWPSQFTVPFNETAALLFSGHTTGMYYYDAANNRNRIDRVSGMYDRYCSTIFPLEDTPCTHLVVDGNRYLDFPAKNSCCLCCNEAAGCGVVVPNWLVLSNATYQGQQTMNGYLSDVWMAMGLQANYWYQTVNTAKPVQLNQVPDDNMTFVTNQYNVGPIPDQMFTIPSYCEPKCPALSICSFLNGEL